MPSPRTLVALALALPWLGWAAVRLVGLDLRHPVVAVVSFTPYAAATAWLPVVGALMLRRRAVALVVAVAAGVLGAAVLPRALGAGRVPSSANGPALRVMSANVYFGRADMAAIVRLARAEDVDVLSLQELTSDAVARLDAAGGRALFPARALRARSGATGAGLLARLPLRDLNPDDVTDTAQPEAELRLPGAQPVRIKAVHPLPPITTRSESAWRAVIAALPRPGAEPRGRSRPPITIDHVLLDERLGVRSFAVHDVPGSDHRAVVAELVLRQG